jgi:hypothetical protein
VFESQFGFMKSSLNNLRDGNHQKYEESLKKNKKGRTQWSKEEMEKEGESIGPQEVTTPVTRGPKKTTDDFHEPGLIGLES